MKHTKAFFAKKTIRLDTDSSSVAVLKTSNTVDSNNNAFYPTEAAATSLATIAVDTTNCSSSNNSREDLRSNNNISINS